MELFFLVGLVAVIVLIPWTVWKMFAREQRLEKATEKATLEQAWRIVLADPHYEQRRQHEEHKHKVEAQLRKEAEEVSKRTFPARRQTKTVARRAGRSAIPVLPLYENDICNARLHRGAHDKSGHCGEVRQQREPLPAVL